jgi:hypothetical protein
VASQLDIGTRVRWGLNSERIVQTFCCRCVSGGASASLRQVDCVVVAATCCLAVLGRAGLQVKPLDPEELEARHNRPRRGRGGYRCDQLVLVLCVSNQCWCGWRLNSPRLLGQSMCAPLQASSWPFWSRQSLADGVWTFTSVCLGSVCQRLECSLNMCAACLLAAGAAAGAVTPTAMSPQARVRAGSTMRGRTLGREGAAGDEAGGGEGAAAAVAGEDPLAARLRAMQQGGTMMRMMAMRGAMTLAKARPAGPAATEAPGADAGVAGAERAMRATHTPSKRCFGLSGCASTICLVFVLGWLLGLRMLAGDVDVRSCVAYSAAVSIWCRCLAGGACTVLGLALALKFSAGLRGWKGVGVGLTVGRPRGS